MLTGESRIEPAPQRVCSGSHESHNFRHPFHSQFRSGLNQTLQGCLGRRWTVGGSVFVSWMAFPQLSYLFWGWFPTVLVYSLYGAVAAVIFRIITALGGVRRAGVDGKHSGRDGVVGADPGS